MTANNQIAEANIKYVAEVTGHAVPSGCLCSPGYKQTEVGAIPDDWGLCTLENIARIIDPQPDHRTPPESLVGEPYIGISDFINDKIVNWEASRKIITKAVDKQQFSFQLNYGDIIFGKIGTIGQPKFIPTVPFRYALSANVLLIQPKIVSYFVMSWLQSKICQIAINSELHSTSQAAFGINKMRKVLIPLPPENEQTAMADALSDVDALIYSLEKLIAKKQAIKTATMQQLLTGRTRLPQFAMREDGTSIGYKQSELGEIPEDWEIATMSALCDVRDGTHDSPKYIDNGIPLVTSKNLVNDVLDLSDVSLISEKNAIEINKRSKVDKGDVIMSMIGTIGSAVLITNEPNFCIKNVALFKPKRIQEEFLIQLIRSRHFQEYLEDSLDGGIQKFVSLGTLRQMRLGLPKAEEQTAIATILTDMDEEIQTLQKRLAKTRQIKQGMMQELLTGKTRLVKPALKEFANV